MRKREQMLAIEQTIRVESINIISCSVKRTPHLSNYVLKAFDIDYNAGVNRALLYDEGDSSIMDFSSPIGVVLFDSKILDPKLEKQYTPKKKAFVKSILDGLHKDVQKELDTIALKMIKEIPELSDSKIPAKFIKILCRRAQPEMAETEIAGLAETIYFFKKKGL
jgi:hypothetical protein